MKLTVIDGFNHKRAGKGCCFEEFRDGMLRACGKPAIVKAGIRNLCLEHAEYAASMGGGELWVEGHNDKGPTIQPVTGRAWLAILRERAANNGKN